MIKHCETCGKEFESRVHNAKFCSECRVEAYRKRKREEGKRYYARHKKKERARARGNAKPLPFVITPEMDVLALRRLDGGESICMWCEKPVQDQRQHFCSDDCANSFYSKVFNSF